MLPPSSGSKCVECESLYVYESSCFEKNVWEDNGGEWYPLWENRDNGLGKLYDKRNGSFESHGLNLETISNWSFKMATHFSTHQPQSLLNLLRRGAKGTGNHREVTIGRGRVSMGMGWKKHEEGCSLEIGQYRMDPYGCMQFMPVTSSLLLDCLYGQEAERTLYILPTNPMIDWGTAVLTAQRSFVSPNRKSQLIPLSKTIPLLSFFFNPH